MQFGFRKKHSTETAVCYFIEQIWSKDKGGVVDAVFLDLQKAFETPGILKSSSRDPLSCRAPTLIKHS